MSTFMDWSGGVDFPKILRDTNTKPMMHSNPELTMSDNVEVIAPDYAMLYTKLVRHITQIEGILLSDETYKNPVDQLELIADATEEAVEFIKLVEKQMMNPIHVLSVDKPKSNNSSDI